MSPHRFLNHTAVPPPDPSPLVFVSSVLLGLIILKMAIVLVASAPVAVTIPLAVVLGAGFLGSGIVILGDRWLDRRRSRQRRRSNRGARIRSTWMWLAAALGLTLVTVAALLNETFAVALSGLVVFGLFALRIVAMTRGWVPRGIPR